MTTDFGQARPRCRQAFALTFVFLAWLLAACGDEADGALEPLCAEPSDERYVRATNPASGVAVAWPSGGCVPWRLDHRGSSDVPQADARSAVQASFETWAAPECATLCFEYAGETDDALHPPAVGYNQAGLNDNVVYFEPSREAWLTRFGVDVLSATVVTSGVESGAILDADIVINDEDYVFTTSGECPQETAADLANVVTHEVGHFIGFGHVLRRDATMYGLWAPPAHGDCEVAKRTLAHGDLQGLCSVYGSVCEQ